VSPLYRHRKLERLKTRRFLSLGLPDGNGSDLMLQLSNDYDLRGIALTGYGMADDVAKTEQAGFLAHLVKPINFDQLRRVLEQAPRVAG
jgi:CheY-like chemotaxis protein